MGWQRGPFHIYSLNEQMEEGGGLGRKKGKGWKCEARRKEEWGTREGLEGCWAQHRGPSGRVTLATADHQPHRCLDPTHSPKPSDHLTPLESTETIHGERLSLVLKGKGWNRKYSVLQGGRIPGNPVSRKTLGFGEVEG